MGEGGDRETTQERSNVGRLAFEVSINPSVPMYITSICLPSHVKCTFLLLRQLSSLHHPLTPMSQAHPRVTSSHRSIHCSFIPFPG